VLVDVFGAKATSTLPDPVAVTLSRIDAQGTEEVAVQVQLGTLVVTETDSAIRPVPELSTVVSSKDRTLYEQVDARVKLALLALTEGLLTAILYVPAVVSRDAGTETWRALQKKGWNDPPHV
jgi:hypothetical protein